MSTDIAEPKPEGQRILESWADEVELTSYAQTRPYIGDFFEEASVQFFGGHRLRTQANKLCPDVKLSEGTYLEVKSVGVGRSSMIYEHRAKKYRQLIRDGERLDYAFWFHCWTFNGRQRLMLPALRRELATTVVRVLLVPAEEVHRRLAGAPRRFTHYTRRDDDLRWKLMPARVLRPSQFSLWYTDLFKLRCTALVYGIRTRDVAMAIW